MPVITADKVGVLGILSNSATQESNKYERKVPMFANVFHIGPGR